MKEKPLVVIDVSRQTVEANGKRIDCTHKERGMLTLLAKSNGKVLTRQDFLRLIWGHDVSVDTRTIDQHMARVRAKLGKSSIAITTVQCAGYRVEPGTVAIVENNELTGRILEVVPIIDAATGTPKLDITYRINYIDPRPKPGQHMRLAELS